MNKLKSAKARLVQLWRGSARRAHNVVVWMADGRYSVVGQGFLLRPRCCRPQNFCCSQ